MSLTNPFFLLQNIGQLELIKVTLILIGCFLYYRKYSFIMIVTTFAAILGTSTTTINLE